MKNNRNKIKINYALCMFLFLTTLAKGQLIVTLSPSNVNCEGLRTGQITANAAGGVPPYQYKWSNSQTTQSISNLDAGYYHCYVIDANGNVAENELTITEPEEFRIIQFDATIYSNNYNTSCFGCNDGAITVTVAGGTPPYSYAWSDGSSLQNRINLVAKDYQLVVTDAFGCQVRELNKELSKPERDDWTPSGNANATINSFIGTINQMPLVLKAGSQEGFRLMPNTNALFSGKIGVGTNNPVEKFEVSGGNARFGGDVRVDGGIKLSNLANGVGGLIGFDGNGTFQPITNSNILKLVYESLDCNAVLSQTNLSNPPHWSVNQLASTGPNQSNLFYHPEILSCFNVGIKKNHADFALDVYGTGSFSDNLFAGGKIGIGTSTPSEKLEITGGALKFNMATSGNVSWAGWQNVIQMPIGSCITTSNVTSGQYAQNQGLRLGFGMTNGGWYFIRSTNNLGDATTTYTKYAAFLTENGEFTCRRVMVNLTSGWSDYVFDKNYKLRSLIDVEKFITEHKHLPDVPSEKELAENGIDTEKMLSVQMKKIEELTLYTIELEKKLEALTNVVKSIKK